MSASARLIGIVALASEAYDCALAEDLVAAAIARLRDAGHTVAGETTLCLDADAARRAAATWRESPVDLVLVLQATFTDAAMLTALAEESEAPLLVWAFPEAKTGGPLRLNALSGLILGMHGLGLVGRNAAWMHGAPDAADPSEAIDASLRRRKATPPGTLRRGIADDTGERIAARLSAARIGLVGPRLDGHPTSAFDDEDVLARFGAEVPRARLDTLFRNAGKIEPHRLEVIRSRIARDLDDSGSLHPAELERACRVFAAVQDVVEAKALDALAVRCRPEALTDHGCAVCGPLAMSTEDGVPAVCGSDVWGALTTLMLSEAADAPAWAADLVDLDETSDTGVVWCCGSAPLSMADPQRTPRAVPDPKSGRAFLHGFALRPGRVTLARLSQARGEPKLVLISGEVLRASPGEPTESFAGTSGILRFDAGVAALREAVLGHALEHRFALAYGELRPGLRAAAAALDLPVLDIA